MGSEVETCRQRLARYCVGNGIDIGFGGDPIVPSAICLDRCEGDALRKVWPNSTPTHLVGDAHQLYWFKDCVLDYVFSSHCLEDFEDTESVMREWLRVIKHGGVLVLFCPDEVFYKRNSEAAGQTPNQAHKHANFSLEYLKKILEIEGMPKTTPVHYLFPVPNNAYSFDMVVQKL